jgi:hypothetical protein
MESGVLLHLFAVAPLVAAPVVLVVIARVIVIIVDGDDTHLWVLGGTIALIDGSGGRNGSGSGQAHLESCGRLLSVVIWRVFFQLRIIVI